MDRPMNKYGVGTTTDGRIFLQMPPIRSVALTPEDALILAAYLVVMTEPLGLSKFEEVYDKIRS
jgi:hypothetical protein